MDCTYKVGRLQIYRVEASVGHWAQIAVAAAAQPSCRSLAD
jgi:hypothetical protein